MITITVNGESKTIQLDKEKFLLQYLRDDLGLVGTKNGCGVGQCGTCTVLIDKQAKRSCITKLSHCDKKEIETVESLEVNGVLHPIQKSFLEEGAVQCGFCTPGMLMTAKALLDNNPNPNLEDIRYAFRNNLCRCTGYGAIFRAVMKAAAILRNDQVLDSELGIPSFPDKFSFIGKINGNPIKRCSTPNGIGSNVVKKDGYKKVTGAKVFAGDYNLSNQLYGKILFTEFPHADILDINIEEAMKLEGVVKIATHKDIKGLNKFGLFVPQQPVLAEDKVKYLGDALACVYARSENIAKEAIKKIKVEYRQLEAQLDPEVNMLEGASLIHSDTDSNIIHHVGVTKGDVEEAFSKADVVIENTYQTQAVEHAYLEPESCLAIYENSKLTLYSGNQGSEAYRRMIAATLNIDIDRVRVIFTATGGGFGGKEEPTCQILAALGSYLTKLPVKMVLSREESIRMSTKRHPMKLYMKHGVTKDGRITGMKSYVIGDAGAYISQTNPVIFRSAVTASGPYATETILADSYGVYTHKNPSGAFRGFGSTQASFACESQIDQLAEAIGMSPYELRRRNGFKEGVITSTGQVLKDGIGYIETLNAVYKNMEKEKEYILAQKREDHIKVGFGLGSAYKNVGIGTGKPDKAGAYVEITKEGRILVSMGAADMGQGVDTIVAQIAATTLQVPYQLIDVVACDTQTCPDGGMTTASRQTFVTGNAVREASELMKSKLESIMEIHAFKELISEETDVNSKQLFLKKLYEKYEGANQLESLIVKHDYYPPKTYAHKRDANHKSGEDLDSYDIHYSYCFASAAIALEVNTLTGEVNIIKVWAAQDVGKALHPINVIGQIEGSVAMGVGLALTEEYVVDDKQIYQTTLKKLGILNSVDIPDMESHIVEIKQEAGPYGAKGMGEVGLNPIAPAIANAIYDGAGIRLKSLPMKPDKVLKALAEKG